MEKVPWAVETASLSPLALSREFFSLLPVTTCLENLLCLPDHSARYILANAYSESLSSQTLRLAFRGLIHARSTKATNRPPKHLSSFDPPFSQFSYLGIESKTNCLWRLIVKAQIFGIICYCEYNFQTFQERRSYFAGVISLIRFF